MTISTTSSSPLLTLSKVNRRFNIGNKSTLVLQNISFTINEGDFVAIIGPSGSGKSTLMNILGGLDRNYQGQYLFQEKNIANLSQKNMADLRSNQFGFIFQRYMLIPQLNAIDNVELANRYISHENHASYKRAKTILNALGLSKRQQQYPSVLSGGEQQRVSIARAIMNQPKIIFADEPSGALDQANSKQVMALLHQLNQAGCTIVLITHEADFANQAARVFSIMDGKLKEKTNHQQKIPPLSKAYFNKSKLAKLFQHNVNKQNKKTIPSKNSASFLFSEILHSLKNVMLHPIRVLLTTLGISIGIASVVAIISIGEGSRKAILQKLSQEIHRVMVLPKYNHSQEFSTINKFSQQEMTTLTSIPEISKLTPVNQFNATVIGHDLQPNKINIQGINQEGLAIFNYQVTQGNYFSSIDFSGNNPVVLINKKQLSLLFNDKTNENVIGKSIIIDNQVFYIIGIYNFSKNTAYHSNSPPILMPISLMSKRLRNDDTYDQFELWVNDLATLENMKNIITQALFPFREDVEVYSRLDQLATINDASQSMRNTLMAVAGIALLIGAIGVMNIVYMSIQERIQEIGIRVAIGANKRNIASQFLLESMLICIIGGLIGIALGFILAFVLSYLNAEWAMTFSWQATLIATGCTLFIGLIFGLFPAIKAANLNPIEALARQ